VGTVSTGMQAPLECPEKQDRVGQQPPQLHCPPQWRALGLVSGLTAARGAGACLASHLLHCTAAVTWW